MNLFISSRPLLSLLTLALISTSLTACETTSSQVETSTGKITAPLPKPASNADILYGESRDNLANIESKHLQKTDDALISARYGKALREAGKLKEARTILLPLSDNKEVGTMVNTELSALYMSEGNFSKAEFAARKAIKQDAANYRAWRNLGNAVDAQEKYVEGETTFRRSMEIWTGDDKVPVMNNLALNLAAQGYTDRALTLLYEAQKLSPERIEIERNIRIIRTLSEPPMFAKPKRPLPESKVPE
jgi:Flp pilus assembly protein TadD